MFTNSSLLLVSFGIFGVFWMNNWLDRKDIGVVVAFDSVDDFLELALIDFKVTNKGIKHVNINV